MVSFRKMRRRERRGLAILICCPGVLHQHHAVVTTTAFAPCPAAGARSRPAGAGRPHSAALAEPPSSALHRRNSGVRCPAGDRARGSRAMFNSVVLLPSPAASSATALAGSKLANTIFRSGGGGSGAAAASLGSQVPPSMQHGLVEALQPLLSYLVVLLRSMWPSPLEVQLVSRLIVAASVGMFIGTERRTSHRPAGVRTMSLVALGACTFTLVSQFGFVGRADQARVAASVASGVGFIGAGVITTSGKEASIRDSLSLRGRGGSRFPSDTPSTYNDVDGEVRGLTTASAIWITAGLGMACGAGLFFVATLGAVLTVGILKISEVITSLRKKWIRVRSILRPKLAQKLAEEEEARVKAEKSGGVVSGLHDDEEDHEEDHEETEEDKELLKEKEAREKEEKEKKEKQLKIEQEKKEKQAEAEKKTIAARVAAAEEGGGVGRGGGGGGSPGAAAAPSETGRADDDDEEVDEFDDQDDDFQDLYKRRSEDVDFEDDPFYGRPWSTEVPKVGRLTAEDGSFSEAPMSGLTRRRSLSRSRVLASRKSRLDQNRLLGLGVAAVPPPSASSSTSAPPQQRPEQLGQGQGQRKGGAQLKAAPASVIPTTVGGGRVAVDSALARPVKTVGDFLLSEKRMERNQQQSPQQKEEQQQLQQQEAQQRPSKKERKPKKLTKQQDSSLAEAYVPIASDDNDDDAAAAPEPTEEALPKKPTKSRGRRQSGGGDGGSGSKPRDGNVQEATPLKTTTKGSSGVPAAAAVVKASTATPGGLAEGKRKAEEVASSRGETAELGEVVEGAAAAARLQADGNVQEATPLKTTIKGSSEVPAAAAVVKASTATPGDLAEGKRKAEEVASSRGETAELGEVVEGAAAAARLQATAEARARLADGWSSGLDGSPDSSV